MIQDVRATDQYGSKLFEWDTDNRVMSIPHGKDIWLVKLDENGEFEVVLYKPKPKTKSNPTKYEHQP